MQKSKIKKLFFDLAKQNGVYSYIKEFDEEGEELAVTLNFYFDKVLVEIIGGLKVDKHLSFLKELLMTNENIFIDMIEVDFCHDIFLKLGDSHIISKLSDDDILKKAYLNSSMYWGS